MASHCPASIKLPPGQIFGLIGILFALIRPLKQISSVNNVFQKGIAGAESIQQLLQAPVEINLSSQRVTQLPTELRFENVSFAYPDEPENVILQNISFSAKRGQTVALVGSSGSGKSSLISLLPRFYAATHGSILLDNHDINNIELHNLRQQIALITQHVILFNDTVANNIAYGNKNIAIQEIRHAAYSCKCAPIYRAITTGI